MMVQSPLQQANDFRSAPFALNPENCWKQAHADRCSVLVDAENYFLAFLSALRQAKESIIILAWDIDTRVNLDPKKSHSGKEVTLKTALDDALEKNPDLHVYILCWDFAMVYTLERQIFPQFRASFRHPRIQFVLDAHHPFGACHHQKVVVIDDQLAFLGGLDLCLRRWD